MEFPIEMDAVASAFGELLIDGEPFPPGGMKNAYLVRSGGERRVLKIIRQPLEDTGDGSVSVPERVRREIESMARIQNPRVVRIVDGPGVRVIQGLPRLWYLEPHIAGGDLSTHFGTPWSEDRALSLASDLLDAVDALWSAGIVHRDIKPQNVALDSDGRAVVLDLGIALVTDLTAITQSAELSPRTTMYAAPEQFNPRGRSNPDFRTDLFAVGLVTYEALTGCHPFRPSEPDGYLGRLFEGRVDDGPFETAGVSRPTERFVRRLLRPHQNQRFRSVRQARTALRECV